MVEMEGLVGSREQIWVLLVVNFLPNMNSSELAEFQTCPRNIPASHGGISHKEWKLLTSVSPTIR